MGDFRRANRLIQRLGLGSRNNSRGNYNGTGYGDYGQTVQDSNPVGTLIAGFSGDKVRRKFRNAGMDFDQAVQQEFGGREPANMYDTGWGQDNQAIGPSRRATPPGGIRRLANSDEYALRRSEDGTHWTMPRMEINKAQAAYAADTRPRIHGEPTGGRYGYNPENPEMEEEFQRQFRKHGISVPPGAKSLYMAPPSHIEQAGIEVAAPLQGGVEERAQDGFSLNGNAGATQAPQRKPVPMPNLDLLKFDFAKNVDEKWHPERSKEYIAQWMKDNKKTAEQAVDYFTRINKIGNAVGRENQRREKEMSDNGRMPRPGVNYQALKMPSYILNDKELAEWEADLGSKVEGINVFQPNTWSFQDELKEHQSARALGAPLYQSPTLSNDPTQGFFNMAAPVGQSMQSSKRPGVLLKPQTPMFDNGMQKRTVSKGFGTLPNPKKPMGYKVAPSGWMDEVPGGNRQLSPQDIANLEGGFSTARPPAPVAEYQPEQYNPQYQQQSPPPMMPPQQAQRPPMDVDQMIDYWNSIKGPKAPLAEFMDNTRRSAGELPPTPQAMYGSPAGGPVGAPQGYAQASVSSPDNQNMIQRFFTNGMRGNMAQMGRQEKLLNQRADMNSADSFMGMIAAPIMGGMLGLAGMPGANDMAGQWEQRAYSRGNDLMNQRNQFINNAQQNTRDGFSMMQASDPSTMKNQIALMNAQANAQRASAYGTNVGNNFVSQQGNLDWKNRSLAQTGQQFEAQMVMAQQKMQQELTMHRDNLALAVQRNQISRQEADQQLQIAQMNNNRALQQMSQQMQISAMEDTTRNRGIEYGAYNNYLSNQGANMRAAAAQHFDKDGNASPATAEWFRQMFGAPAPVQAPQQDAGGWFGNMFGGGQQQQPPQNPTMQAALSHYRALPPQQQQALRGQFMQKFGIDPGGN